MMDLQLGLAVSRNSASTKDFDLNFSEFEFNNNMEQRCRPRRNHVKKRGFYEASSSSSEEKNVVDQTLPLLLWNDEQPKPTYQEKEDDDDDDVDQDNLDSSSSTVISDNNYKIDERGTNGLVGWPPINPSRKRICHRNNNLRGGFGGYSVTVENGGTAAAACANNRGKNSSLYVKVKMEGVGIARKVDLSLHHSPRTLLQTLLAMFGKCQESIHSYLLSFQDQEGDWQLADQVPWRVFIESVQRLKLHRKTTD